jgi:putative ABC transport system substrate-binding protein
MKRREFITLLGGAAVACPLAARAQQPAKIHRIAIVHPSVSISEMNETGDHPYYPALFKELRRLGYVEGKNLVVARYSGEGREDRYPELCRNVVGTKPDVIVTSASRLVLSFKAATHTIPVVASMADPVPFGIVTSLARPGGNITGVSVEAGLEIWASVCKSCAKPFRQHRRWGSSVRAKYGTYRRSPRRGRPPLMWGLRSWARRSKIFKKENIGVS